MGEPIQDEYFGWLCAKALPAYSQNYVDLMRILYRTEFVWLISGDRNRVEDGVELRDYFLREAFMKKDPESDWFNEPCSVLEVLIAFAKRAEFQTDIPVRDWFWTFLANLDLDEYRRVSSEDLPLIEEILYIFIWRTYNASGYGGLFPLDNPEEDQRKVEIWYQFCAWVDEKELV
jgi:hypothetical protein